MNDPVTVGDIRRHVNRKCRLCFGKGILVVSPPHEQARQVLCGCCNRGFMKANGSRVALAVEDGPSTQSVSPGPGVAESKGL